MGNDKLDALVKIGQLRAEKSDSEEVDSLVASGKACLMSVRSLSIR